MSAETPLISMIFPWRERLDGVRVQNCFNSLKMQTVQPEVIIVDYGSQVSEAVNFPEAMKNLCAQYGWVYRYVTTDDYWTFGIPANMGVRMAKGNIIVVTGGIDYVFRPNFVEAIVSYSNSLDIRQHLLLCTLRSFPYGYDPSGFNWDDFDRVALPHCAYNNAVLGAHRDWWFKVHGFDERFRGWGEVDNDLVYRARIDRLLALDLERERGGKTSLYHQPHEYQGHVHGIYDKINLHAICDNTLIKNDENWGTEQSPFFSKDKEAWLKRLNLTF